jgi:HemY protein
VKSLFWLLAVFAAAVALVLVGRIDAGYVLFVYPPWRVEMSMLFFAFAAVAGFAALYWAVRLLGQALSLPSMVSAFRRRRRRERAQASLVAALQAYYEGRYARAEKEAAAAVEGGAVPGLAALLAARAAHQMRDFDRPDPPGCAPRHARRARARRARLQRSARRAAQPAWRGPQAHREPEDAAASRARRRRLGGGAAARHAAREARRHCACARG